MTHWRDSRERESHRGGNGSGLLCSQWKIIQCPSNNCVIEKSLNYRYMVPQGHDIITSCSVVAKRLKWREHKQISKTLRVIIQSDSKICRARLKMPPWHYH